MFTNPFWPKMTNHNKYYDYYTIVRGKQNVLHCCRYLIYTSINISLAYLDCCAYDQLHSDTVSGCTVSLIAMTCVRKVINKIWAAICYFDNSRFMTPTWPSIETNFGISRCVRSSRMASSQPTRKKSSTTMFAWVFGGHSSSWGSCKPVPTAAHPVWGHRCTASLITIWLINNSIIGVSLVVVKVGVGLALLFTWH